MTVTTRPPPPDGVWQTCILGFLCLYVAEQYERETTDKAQKEKDFLNSFLSPILEVTLHTVPFLRARLTAA